MSFSFDAGASIYLLVLAAVLVAVAIAVLVDMFVHWKGTSYTPVHWREWDRQHPGWDDWGF